LIRRKEPRARIQKVIASFCWQLGKIRAVGKFQ
jgi:hypothetical protein